MVQIAGFLKGLKNKKNEELKQNYGFGMLNDLKIDEIEAVLRKMIYEDVLIEKSVKCSKKFKMTKLEIGPRSEALFNGSIDIITNMQSIKLEERPNMPENIKEVKNYNSLNKNDSPQKIINEINNWDASVKCQNMGLGNLIYSNNLKARDEQRKAIPPGQLESRFINRSISPKQSPIDFIPRIPYTKNIEIILDDTPIKFPELKSKVSISSDLYEELKSRLEIVRKRLSRQLGCQDETILSNSQLDLIANTMSGNVHPDFLKEINYFNEINFSKESYAEISKSTSSISNSDKQEANISKRFKFNN